MTQDYEAFKEVAEKNGLPNVTEEEWATHVEAHPKLPLRGWLKRIRHERTQAEEEANRETQTIKGFVLGTYDKPKFVKVSGKWKRLQVESSKAELVPIAHGGQITEAYAWDSTAKMQLPLGQKVEMVLEKSKDYDSYSIRKWSVLDGGSFKPGSWKWKNPDDLDRLEVEKNERPWFLVKGSICNVWGMRNFNEKNEDGTWADYDYDSSADDYPTALLCMHGEKVWIDAQFDKRKNGRILSDIAEFRCDISETHEELRTHMDQIEVGVLGRFDGIYSKKRGKKEYTAIKLHCTAIFDFMDEGEEGEYKITPNPDPADKRKEKPAAAEPKPKPKPKATSKDKKKAHDATQKLLAGIREGIDQFGDAVTADLLIEKGFVNENLSKSLIKSGIRKVMKEETSEKTTADTFKNFILAEAEDGIQIDYLVEQGIEKGLTENDVDTLISDMLDLGVLYEPRLGAVQKIKM
jgi:hypothetical protein